MRKELLFISLMMLVGIMVLNVVSAQNCTVNSDCPQPICTCAQGYICNCETKCINGSCVTNSTSIPVCTDSDSGKNYYVKGTFSGLWNGVQLTNTDSCVDALDDTGDDVTSSNYLGEGYCENNQLKVERITCSEGCNNGVCIPTPVSTCTDSDGGVNYYSQGEVRIVNSGGTDCCVSENSATSSCTASGNYLSEKFCYDSFPGKGYNSGGGIGYLIYNCQNGCKDGACLKDNKFYISAVDGIKEQYYAGQEINLVIKGVEPDGTPGTPEEGFNVQVYVDEWPLVPGQPVEFGDNAQYKEGYWYDTVKIPDKIGKHRLQVALYCSRDDSMCMRLYGRAAQVENTYYFSTIKGEQVTEKITCKFENTKTEQKCYLAGQWGSDDLGTKYCIAAAGTGSCVIAYTGYKGEQVEWKSSCGNIATTTQDGTDEVIYFKCESGETNITEIKNKGFTNVYFQCYDGAESKSTDREACKSADYWKKFASNFCAAHCENDPKKCKQKYQNQEDIDKCLGKCGVNSFSIGNECYLEEELTECNKNNLGEQICINKVTASYCGVGGVDENGKINKYSWINLTCSSGYCIDGFCKGTDEGLLIEHDIGNLKYSKTFPYDGKMHIIDYIYPGALNPTQVWLADNDPKWCKAMVTFKGVYKEIKDPNGHSIIINDSKNLIVVDGNWIWGKNSNSSNWISFDKCLSVINDKDFQVTKEYLKRYSSSCDKNGQCLFNPGIETQCKEDNDCYPSCGINSDGTPMDCTGGVKYKCIDGKCVSPTTPDPTLICKDSCALDGKCYDFGYRKSGKYCSDSGGFVEQKKSESCDNNFECTSNVCVNSKCISEGFLQKIMSWFSKLFGGK